jgi:hypothetical protein
MLARTDQVSRAIALGEEHLYQFKVLQKGGMITQPFYENGSYYEQTDLSDDLPPQILERARFLLDHGIRPVGYIIRHEVPIVTVREVPKREIPWGKIALVAGAVFLVPVIIMASLVLIMALAIPLIFLAMLVLTAGMVDPELIAVIPVDDPSGNWSFVWLSLGEWLD